MAVYKSQKFSKRKNKMVTSWEAKFNYRDENGKPKQHKKEGFRTRTEANDYEKNYVPEWVIRKAEEEKKVKEPTMEELEVALIEKEGILFSELYEKYMRNVGVDNRVTTQSNKECLFRTKILPYFGDKRVKTITITEVKEWQTMIKEKKYSKTYLKTIHNQMSAIFNHGVDYYGVPENLARKCGKMGKKHSNRTDYYTIEQFDTFIDTFNGESPEWMMFSLLFYTGIREGEMLALTRRDIKFEERKISIVKSYARHEGQDLIHDTKTEEQRVVALPSCIEGKLKEYLEKIPNLKDDDRIFTYTKSHVNTHMRKGYERSGLEKRIRVHDLRHSYASMLINRGIDIKTLAEMLGHIEIETTSRTYAHMYPGKIEEVANILDDIYNSYYH
jgi:integrase